jgi:4-carboxymuconolactone decarboxylase
MGRSSPAGAEQVLRELAAGDETALRSALEVSRRGLRTARFNSARTLSPETGALVQLAALLTAGGSTTSLRWAVELALQAGADDDAIVEVLVTTAAIVGAARVVAAAPRLALAIGYDVEIPDCDED